MDARPHGDTTRECNKGVAICGMMKTAKPKHPNTRKDTVRKYITQHVPGKFITFEQRKLLGIFGARAHTRALYGGEIALCAKIHVRKLKKSSMDGNAQAETCTRKLAWFRSATCMDGLKNRNHRGNMSRLIGRRLRVIRL